MAREGRAILEKHGGADADALRASSWRSEVPAESLRGALQGRARQGRGHARAGRASSSSAPRRSCRRSSAARPISTPRRRRPSRARRALAKGDFDGRNIHFGIREHAMGAFVNGIAVSRRVHPLRLDVPHLQRLHAPGDPPRGALAPAVDLRLHARQRVPRRGRPDAPAGRALLGAAPHPEPRLRAAVRRARVRDGVGPRARAQARADGARALAPEARQHPAPGRLRQPDDAARRLRARRRRRRADARRSSRPAPRSRSPSARRRSSTPRASASASCRRPAGTLFERQDAAYRDAVLPAGRARASSIEIGVTEPWRGVVGDGGARHRPRRLRRLGARQGAPEAVRLHARGRRREDPRLEEGLVHTARSSCGDLAVSGISGRRSELRRCAGSGSKAERSARESAVTARLRSDRSTGVEPRCDYGRQASSSTLTSLLLALATARSSLPFPSKSPMATPTAVVPVAWLTGAAKVPLPVLTGRSSCLAEWDAVPKGMAP